MRFVNIVNEKGEIVPRPVVPYTVMCKECLNTFHPLHKKVKRRFCSKQCANVYNWRVRKSF